MTFECTLFSRSSESFLRLLYMLLIYTGANISFTLFLLDFLDAYDRQVSGCAPSSGFIIASVRDISVTPFRLCGR